MKQLDLFKSDNVTVLIPKNQKVMVTVNPQEDPRFDPQAVFRYWEPVLAWFAPPHRPEVSAVDIIKKYYQFGVIEMIHCIIAENGDLSYPGDPTQVPLVKLERFGEIVWFYQSSIIAVVQRDGSQYVTRVD